MKRATTVAAILLGLALAGCAHMHVVCQDAGTTTLAVGGSTVGQQLITAGLAAAKTAGFMAVAPQPLKAAAPTAQAQSFVDYNYMPVFGPDYASCTTNPPPTAPSTSIITMEGNGQPPNVVTVGSGQVVFAPPQGK